MRNLNIREDFERSGKYPSTFEAYDIFLQIVDNRFKLDYVARKFHISIPGVNYWKKSCQDIFTRMKNFIRDLRDDGCEDLAIRLTQLFCAAIGRESVPAPEKEANFLSLLKAVTDNSKESADVQIAWCQMVGDQVATLKEIRAAKNEVVEQIEASRRLLAKLELLEKQAADNGGTIQLDMEKLRK